MLLFIQIISLLLCSVEVEVIIDDVMCKYVVDRNFAERLQREGMYK